MRSVVAAWFGQLLKARTAIEAQRRQQEKSNHLDVSMKYRWMVQQFNFASDNPKLELELISVG
jgi:hypothetical protein